MKRLTTIPDARHIWHRLWSVRLAILSAILSAIEIALPFVAPTMPSGRFAIAAFIVSVAAGIARIVAQPKVFDRG